MPPDHSLLPELRRKRFMAAEHLRDSLRDLDDAQRRHAHVVSQVEKLDQLIAENDFYKPPPRPSI